MKPKLEERLRVKAWFDASGLSITQWAAEHGFKREQVYAFLNGRTSGRRGASHHIAVALLLKAEPGPLQPPGGSARNGIRFDHPSSRGEDMTHTQ
jgi:gp16 family phage-associated protein